MLPSQTRLKNNPNLRYSSSHHYMTYARARLWLGISGVGCIVMLSLTALRLDHSSNCTTRRQFRFHRCHWVVDATPIVLASLGRQNGGRNASR